MSEFKITQALPGTVNLLKSMADILNTRGDSLSSDDVNTLKTGMAYVVQHWEIGALLDSYKGMLLRDVQDFNQLIDEANALDKALSASFNPDKR